MTADGTCKTMPAITMILGDGIKASLLDWLTGLLERNGPGALRRAPVMSGGADTVNAP